MAVLIRVVSDRAAVVSTDIATLPPGFRTLRISAAPRAGSEKSISAKAADHHIELLILEPERLTVARLEGNVRHSGQAPLGLRHHRARDVHADQATGWPDRVSDRLGNNAGACCHVEHILAGFQSSGAKKRCGEMKRHAAKQSVIAFGPTVIELLKHPSALFCDMAAL